MTKGESAHQYELLFHLNAGEADVEAATKRVSTRNADAANLALIPLAGGGLDASVVKGREEEEVQGWAAEPWRPVPTAVYHKSGKGVVRFVTVLYPTARGQALPVAAVEPVQVAGEDAVAARIRLADGRSHLFLQADAPGKPRAFDGWSTDGELALVELGADGRPGRRILVSGKALRRD